MTDQKIYIKNKKAYFEYAILDEYIAGIVLQGTEIKSLRNHKASFTDSYCTFKNNELWIKSFHISEYEYGTYNNHNPKQDRKLLLNRIELRKLQKKIKEGGMTVIPLAVFINKNGIAKIKIALAKGKKLHDKRDSIKEKDLKREMDRKKQM